MKIVAVDASNTRPVIGMLFINEKMATSIKSSRNFIFYAIYSSSNSYTWF